MTSDIFSSTFDFADPSVSAAVATTASVPKASLMFYSLRRLDLTTELTLAAALAKSEVSEEDAFAEGAVRSAPQSWREL